MSVKKAIAVTGCEGEGRHKSKVHSAGGSAGGKLETVFYARPTLEALTFFSTPIAMPM